jgi:hypothetical protein
MSTIRLLIYSISNMTEIIHKGPPAYKTAGIQAITIAKLREQIHDIHPGKYEQFG